MAEEHGFQEPEGPCLCANNCGFFGSPATQNFCSKCYRDLCLKDQKSKPGTAAADNLFSLTPPSSLVPSVKEAAAAVVVEDATSSGRSAVSAEEMKVAVESAARPNRCTVCRKKVGLTGFRCKCGTTFCGTHRYPEQHGCNFDFKSMGRDAIAKANPLVKAAKLEKI